ncbi:hypothetical protein NC652_012495 [Populus alba x Populus x berolinensis]|nr:hypothetical protein NC652_012495 [Populus alba x Populus x berolinensis]
MSTTGRRAATETGPVNGIRSPLNLSIKLILYAWASSNIHHQLNLWAFFLVLQQIMSSTLLPCFSPPRLLLRCSASTPSTQQSLPSPPWLLLLLPGGLRRLLLYPHTAVAIELYMFTYIYIISVHHTSASLTINENYDSDVRDDTETFLNKIFPEIVYHTRVYVFREDLPVDAYPRSFYSCGLLTIAMAMLYEIIIVLGDQLLPLNSGAK